MGRTAGKTISFVEVTITREELSLLVIKAAREEAAVSNKLKMNGISHVETDKYGGFLVLLQKED